MFSTTAKARKRQRANTLLLRILFHRKRGFEGDVRGRDVEHGRGADEGREGEGRGWGGAERSMVSEISGTNDGLWRAELVRDRMWRRKRSRAGGRGREGARGKDGYWGTEMELPLRVKLVLVRPLITVDPRRPLCRLVQIVRTFVFLSHPVHNEHDKKNCAEKAHDRGPDNTS